MSKKGKIRIAFIVNFFPKISESFILDQVTYLLKQGHKVDIYPRSTFKEVRVHENYYKYALEKNTFYPPELSSSMIIRFLQVAWIILAHINKISSFIHLQADKNYKNKMPDEKRSMFESIVPFLNDRKYDIVHCHWGPSGLFAMFLRSLGLINGKVITSFYGFDISINSINKDYYKRLFTECTSFIAITRYVANKAIALGCPRDNIKIIPLGIEPGYYSSRKTPRKGPLKLLSVGRLVEKKGHIYAIRAVKEIISQNPHIIYDIVGEGPLREDLQSSIAELELSENIKLHGAKNKEEIKSFYFDADIFILPCVTANNGETEGQCLVLIEAQAAQLPVISTFHNGIQEGVRNEVTGYLVPERDINGLEEKLDLLIANTKLRLDMGKAGRDFVFSEFNQVSLLDSQLSYYQDHLDEKC